MTTEATAPAAFEPTARTTLGRFPVRARYDHETVHAILDSAFLCHVGYVRDGLPFVTPTSFWRIGEVLYWHGSAESSMLRAVVEGLPVCFTVSHADGLVLSRVMSRHSFNYRSVVVLGQAVAVRDLEEKMRGMRAFTDRMLPGRWADNVQPVSQIDIERITIVRMDLREASAKVRSGPPKDNELLHDRARTWAGHIPFKIAVGEPVPDPNLKFDIPVPDYVRSLAARFGAQDLAGVTLDMPQFAPPAATAVPANSATSADTHVVEVLDTGAAFPAPADKTLLASALAAGADLPYGCASGGCGACRVRLVSGSVEMLAYERAALPDAERHAGWVLACCALPRSNCAIVPRRAPAGLAGVQPLSAVVSGVQQLTHDIVGLRLTPAVPLAFESGQFVMLRVADLPEREYSIASQPGAAGLELHIRVAPSGRVSNHIAQQLRAGDTVGIRGPFGVSVYQDEDRPLLAMAGGTGLAPILSIVERALQRRASARITLYFGVRDQCDLYHMDRLAALAKAHPGFRLHAVLSAPGGAASGYRTGYLAQALAADAPSLAESRVFIAGPPVMVESCTAAALQLGADPSRVHVDAFVNKPPAPPFS